MRIRLAASLLFLATTLYSADFNKSADELLKALTRYPNEFNMGRWTEDKQYVIFHEAHEDGIMVTERASVIISVNNDGERLNYLEALIPAPKLKQGIKANKINKKTEDLVKNITTFLHTEHVDQQIIDGLNAYLYDNKADVAKIAAPNATVHVEFDPGAPKFILTFMAK